MAAHPHYGTAIGGTLDAERVYPVVDVAGDAFAMGLQHGEQLAERIRVTVATLRSEAAVGDAAYDAAWPHFQPTVEYCRGACPELVREMEGIAEGSSLPFKDIFLINAHLDVTVWASHHHAPASADGQPELPGCSSHAVQAGANGVCLGWNGDDLTAWMDTGAVIRGRPSDGRPPFVYFGWAGTVGRPGMSHSVAVGANSLPAPGWRADGILYNMACRLMLQAEDTEAALAVLDRCNTCSAMNYLLADASGELADIETDGTAVRVLRPEEGEPYLLHTNHYEHEEQRPHNALRTAAWGPGGVGDCPRLRCARELYAAADPTAAGVESVFEGLGTPPVYQDPARPNNDKNSETVSRERIDAQPLCICISPTS